MILMVWQPFMCPGEQCVQYDPMDTTLLTSLVTLLPMMCVIIGVAYLLTRSRIFPEIPRGHPALTVRILMIVKVM